MDLCRRIRIEERQGCEKINLEYFFQFLAALSFVMLSVMKISEPIKIICSILELIIGVSIFLFYGIKNKFRVKYRISLVVLILALSSFINYIIIGAISVTVIAKMFLVHMPIALVLFCNKKLDSKIWGGCFLFLSFFLMYRLFNSIDGYRIFADTSRNYISIVLLLSACFYEISLRQYNSDVGVITPFIVFLCSVFAQGRGGVLASFILLLLYIFIKYYYHRGRINNIKWLVGTVFLLFFFVIIIFNYNSILNLYFPRFTAQQSASVTNSNQGRALLYYSYFLGVQELKHFLFGFNMIGTSWLATLEGGNIHNSFLQIHSYLGLMGFLIFVYSFGKSIKKMITRKELLLAIFIIGFLIRIFTDYSIPGSIGDILGWYLVFMTYEQTAQQKNMRAL